MLNTIVSVVLLAALFWGFFASIKYMDIKDFKLGISVIGILLLAVLLLHCLFLLIYFKDLLCVS
jgi:hypothetical protein